MTGCAFDSQIFLYNVTTGIVQNNGFSVHSKVTHTTDESQVGQIWDFTKFCSKKSQNYVYENPQRETKLIVNQSVLGRVGVSSVVWFTWTWTNI